MVTFHGAYSVRLDGLGTDNLRHVPVIMEKFCRFIAKGLRKNLKTIFSPNPSWD